jgi:hypothetical protein
MISHLGLIFEPVDIKYCKPEDTLAILEITWKTGGPEAEKF